MSQLPRQEYYSKYSYFLQMYVKTIISLHDKIITTTITITPKLSTKSTKTTTTNMGSIEQQARKMRTAVILAVLATAIFTSAAPYNTAATLPAEHTHKPYNPVDNDSTFKDTSKKTSTTKSTTASSMSDAEKEKLLLGLGIRTITKEAPKSTPSIASTLSDSEKEKLLLGRAFTTKTRKASRYSTKTDLTLSKSEKKRLLLDLPLLSAQYNLRLGRC